MGALHLTISRAGTIRRVIRRGSHYICGLCRSTYTSENTAQGCIQNCWIDLLALDPVIVKRRMIGVAYRCRFCARDYAQRPDAAVCAEDCKAHQLRLHEAEQSLTDQSDEPPRKRLGKHKQAPGTTKLTAVKAAPAAASAPRAVVPKAPVVDTSQNPINADAIPLSANTDAANSANSTGGSGSGSGGSSGAKAKVEKESEMLHGVGTGAYGKKAEEQQIHGVGTGSYSKKEDADAGGKSMDSGPNKLKTSDAFYRDGARYVCNNCNTKYFTRGEVETCFAGHK